MKSRLLVFLIAVVALVSTSFVNSASADSTAASPTTTAPSETVGDNTSVVWLVLDEAPLYALLKTDGTINAARYPGFAKLASVSTWYRNTLATAQRTTEAIPSMLTGTWPTFRDYPVFRDHPKNLFTIARRYKKIEAYQSVTSLCPRNVCKNRIPVEQREAAYNIRAFQDLVQKSTTATEPTIFFSHILLPHRPWRFATDGRLGRNLETDPRPSDQLDRRRDAYQSLLRQFIATDTLLLEYLNKLEQSANWNQTLLIVTSDHGMTFVPGESFRDTVNRNNPGTLEDIFRIPLFIKYPSQTSATSNDCPVSSVDILPTVLSVAKIPTKAKFDGVDLSSTCPKRTYRRVRWPYTGKNLNTNFRDLVKRVAYYDKWVDADGSVDDIHRVGLSGQLLGTSVPTGVAQTKGLRWRNIDRKSFANIGDTKFSYVPSRVSGLFSTTRSLCSRCEGVLVVDGVIVAAIPEIAGQSATSGPSYFTTSLKTSTITPASSEPELWIVDWSKSTPRFIRVGPAVTRHR